LGKEVEWLRAKKDQVEQKVAEMEKSVCDAESAFENVPLTPSDISQNTKQTNKNHVCKPGHQNKSAKTR
jgi:hypothetical protein